MVLQYLCIRLLRWVTVSKAPLLFEPFVASIRYCIIKVEIVTDAHLFLKTVF